MFVELASYVQKNKSIMENCTRLGDLVGKCEISTQDQAKGRFLEYFKEAQEQFDGRNTFLVFKEGMRNVVREKRLLRRRTNFGQGCSYNKERHF